jgi:hypothetical protein
MPEEVTERVAYQERETRRLYHLIDAIERRSDAQFIAISAHLDRQDKDVQDLKESMDKRFADMSANIADIRNILATLVQKLEK